MKYHDMLTSWMGGMASVLLINTVQRLCDSGDLSYYVGVPLAVLVIPVLFYGAAKYIKWRKARRVSG